MRRVLLPATVLVLSAGAAPAQQVQGLCGERREMQAQLRQGSNQLPVGATAYGSGLTVELLMSESGGWSTLLTFPDGRSCLVDQAAAGERPPPGPFIRRR